MLNYRIEGNGPPLLMIHGLGVTYTIWENLAPLLCKHFSLVMVELPGNGGSPMSPPGQPYYPACADAIESLRLHLGIPRWRILGYSLGAWVEQAYLNRYAESVEQAIFLCPARAVPAWSMLLRGLFGVDRLFSPVSVWLLSGWRLHRLVLALGFNNRPHPYAAVWTREIAAQPIETIKTALRELPDAGRAAMPVPKLPSLFIWGDRDAITDQPRPSRPVDCFIHGNHSSPMLAAPAVAQAVLQFTHLFKEN